METFQAEITTTLAFLKIGRESSFEIATQGTNTSYYSPPIRNWGFYELFKNGTYPPGTPNVRSFKKINFRFITQNEYQSLLDDL